MNKEEMSKRFKLLEAFVQQGFTSEKEIAKLDIDILLTMFPNKMDDFKRAYALVKAAKSGRVIEFLAGSDAPGAEKEG